MAFTTAVNRLADVTIGTSAALLVTFLLPALADAPEQLRRKLTDPFCR